VRPELVTQCVDERMQTATATAGVVDTPAGIRASVRTPGRATATSPATVGATTPPDMGRRRPALGVDRDLAFPSTRRAAASRLGITTTEFPTS
jgi:hypothetical protein